MHISAWTAISPLYVYLFSIFKHNTSLPSNCRTHSGCLACSWHTLTRNESAILCEVPQHHSPELLFLHPANREGGSTARSNSASSNRFSRVPHMNDRALPRCQPTLAGPQTCTSVLKKLSRFSQKNFQLVVVHPVPRVRHFYEPAIPNRLHPWV